jgi:hypothetical protein
MSGRHVIKRLIRAKYDESPADRYPQEGPLADHLIAGLRAAGYAVVRVPDIACKGPHDTNGTMLIGAASKAERGFPVGGSNVGRAVAQVLRETAAAADAAEATS